MQDDYGWGFWKRIELCASRPSRDFGSFCKKFKSLTQPLSSRSNKAQQMAVQSPTCEFDFLATRARGIIIAARAKNTTPRGSGKTGRSSPAQRETGGQFTESRDETDIWYEPHGQAHGQPPGGDPTDILRHFIPATSALRTSEAPSFTISPAVTPRACHS